MQDLAIPLPAADEPLIVWSARYGRAAIERLNALSVVRFDVTTAGANVRYPLSMIGLDTGHPVVALPLKLPVGIPNAFNTAASAATTVNLLLQALRDAGYLPAQTT